VLVTNIQRFSLHDGPGIRTTVFLKGCTLRCPWCSNPENISAVYEHYQDGEKKGVYGKELSLSKIYDEVVKDCIFYEGEGGVTFSGGEPLLFTKNLEPLLSKLKAEHISIAVETALFVPIEDIDLSLQYVDFYCIDIKILDKEKCRKFLGGNIDIYKENVNRILSTNVKTLFRVPLIFPYTTNETNIYSIAEFCQENRINFLELIKGHNLAEKKYISLNRDMYNVPEISDMQIQKISNIFAERGISTKICRV